MNIGTLIKNARIQKGLTQKELADLLGTTPQNLNQYENNRRKPKIDTLRGICGALEITIGDLGDDIWKYYGIEEIKEDFVKAGKNIQITISSKMPDSLEEKKRNELIEAFNELSSHGKEEAPHLLDAFSSLNSTGQTEAVKRVNELSKIEGYRKGDPEYEPEPPQF